MGKPPIRVLLVEDNPGDVLLIRQMLAESQGTRFELATVARLSAAVGALSDPRFGLVLLDLSLPDSQGLDTFRALRGAGVQLPVVVLTGLDDEALAVQAVREGAQDYLVKGQTDGRRLLHALRYAVGRYQRQRQLEDAVRHSEAELEMARKVHRALLPCTHPTPPGLDVFGDSLSAGAVGGDLFQYLTLPDGTLALAVADVTGHGLGPSLLMVAVRSYLRALAQREADVGQILTLANRLFAQDVTDGNNCTLFLAKVDPAGQTFTYASAGHHPPALVVSAGGDVKARLYSTGLPLGLLPDAEFGVDPPVPLEQGDVLLLLTDGVVEARSATKEPFGSERVLSAVRGRQGEGARAIVEALFRSVRDFRQGVPPVDDITAVAVEVTRSPAGAHAASSASAAGPGGTR
jgi:sigma-B regulation protein RsbU (phosphoserine phosphatase)